MDFKSNARCVGDNQELNRLQGQAQLKNLSTESINLEGSNADIGCWALLLTLCMAYGLLNDSVSAVEKVCSVRCDVKGEEYGCDGLGQFGTEFARCKDENAP